MPRGVASVPSLSTRLWCRSSSGSYAVVTHGSSVDTVAVGSSGACGKRSKEQVRQTRMMGHDTLTSCHKLNRSLQLVCS